MLVLIQFPKKHGPEKTDFLCHDKFFQGCAFLFLLFKESL